MVVIIFRLLPRFACPGAGAGKNCFVAMLRFPDIDPVAFSLGSISVYWYGLMYLLGFAVFLVLGRLRARGDLYPDITPQHIEGLLFYGVLGAVLGGRVGYVLLYGFPGFVAKPWTVFMIWQGGMSFHGGLIGVLVALWLFCRRHQMRFLQLTDFVAPLVPPGIGAGRLGNFINGELWGRAGEVPWAMVFPHVDSLPRHPAQLYQLLLEGLVMFAVLWVYSSKRRPPGAVSGLFVGLYALVRIFAEFFREPDAHIGFVAWGWLTMGQLLSLPLLLAGAWLVYHSRRQRPPS